MAYLTMTEAKRESGTTKNPILKAIKAGIIKASKNDLGHWNIDEVTFRNWLALRTKTAEIPSAKPSPLFVNLARGPMRHKLTAKVEQLSAQERDHWAYFRSAPPESRQDVLNAILGIRQQRDLIHELLAA